MIPLLASHMCGNKNCYNSADIVVYRNKKTVYVCKEHSQQPKKDIQLELFSGTTFEAASSLKRRA